MALASRNRNPRSGRANERSERQQEGKPSAGRFLTKGSRHPDRRRRRSLRGGAVAQGLGNREDTGVPPGRTGSRRREPPFEHFASRDDTGCPRSSRRRGLMQAGIASTSLRFGAATHVACRLIPACSGTPRARSRMVSVARRAIRREGELRESDGREIGRRRGSQKAWLLARAVMKPEAITAARRKSGRRGRTRTEAAASRGGGSRAPAGVPVRRKAYGRSWMFGSWPPSKRHAESPQGGKQDVGRG